MNTALTWLLLTRIKNGIRRFVRKPSRLILAVIVIALIGFTIFAGHLDDAENPSTATSGSWRPSLSRFTPSYS